MSSRILHAWINGQHVGTLTEPNGIWQFEYSPSWVTAPGAYALSPHLPLESSPLLDSGSIRNVQWYFDNLLPEEGQRKLLASDVEIDHADAFGLLAAYGAESTGSLILTRNDEVPKSQWELIELPDGELQKRIERMPQLPLTHGAPKRMSLAGAQHKLAVVLDGEKICEPIGSTPSTHILKPNHHDGDYPQSVINEWFVMRLARELGLSVPNVERRYVPSPVYIIERFDRVNSDAGWQRVHAIDGCQLLGLDRLFKYSQGSVGRLVELSGATRSLAASRVEFFKWLTFNVLVGNGDAHLKNLSFLVSSRGMEVAPAYDLLSTEVYSTKAFDKDGWPRRSELAWPLLEARRFVDVDRNTLLRAGELLNIPAATARRIMDKMISEILPAASRLADLFESENISRWHGRSDLQLTFLAERRCIDAIRHVIIRDMVQKLSG